MKHKLYLECLSGMSGVMMVGAFLDLGADEEKLREVLKSVPVSGFEVKISHVKKMGIAACDFEVRLDEAHENHDHDMEYLYGKDIHKHDNLAQEEAGHTHHHHHHHEHRGKAEIFEIIEHTKMEEPVKTLAKRIFTILGDAEAKAHGTTPEEVHFHEGGAVDSIVDIIATAVCLHDLGVNEVIIPKLCEGTGEIRCAHGVLPIPVPAVSNIIASYHLPVHITDREGELVTPTGAAIAAAICTTNRLPETFTVQKIGIGAGKREYEKPSLLRAMLIEDETPFETDTVYKLESNIDDCTGEMLGHVMELLFAAGAKDVHYFPVYMKKNRPAYQLNVLCEEKDIKKLENIVFKETTTIGIRRQCMKRSILQRRAETILTEYGEILYKVCNVCGEERYYPEYESVLRVCEKNNISYQKAYQLALLAAAERNEA